MSLLMKALKQAEQSKKSADRENAAPAPEDTALIPEAQPELELESAPAVEIKPMEAAEFKPRSSDLQTDTAPSLPDKFSEGRFKDTDSTGIKKDAIPPTATQRPSFAPPAGRGLAGANDPQKGKHGQAQNLFAAKGPVRSKHKPLFWAIAAAMAVMITAIQGYRLWHEYTRPTNFSSAVPIPSSMPLAAPIEKPQAEAPLASNPSPEVASLPATEAPAPDALAAAPASAEPKTLESPAAAVAGNTDSSLIPKKKPGYRRAARPAGTRAPRLTTGSRNDETVDPQFFSLSGRDPIRITPSKQIERSGSQIDLAYQSFLRNDFVSARKAYLNALESDSSNRDALLGLAAIAVKDRQLEEAATYYKRLLALDPKDAAAQAGMIGLTGGADAAESESRIKTALSRQPNADYLYFALGNIYLSRSRWPEAQEAFFHAYQLNPANPDYAFNLAVSLDHLNQLRPAADFYQKSLELSYDHPANFDRDILENRLHTLTAEKRP